MGLVDVVKNVGTQCDYPDSTRGYASDVNVAHMEPLQNKSGGDLVTGDVAVFDTANAGAVTTTTTAGCLLPVYIVPQQISGDNAASTKTVAANETAFLYRAGAYVPAVNCDAVAVSIGEYLKCSGTAKKATGTGVLATASVPPPVGSFAVALASKGAVTGAIPCQMLGWVAGGIGGRAVATTAPTQGNVLGYNGSTWLPVGGMYLIEDQELASDAASITFSAIPQVFKHLKLYARFRSDYAANNDNVGMQFNGDTGNNYVAMIGVCKETNTMDVSEAISVGFCVVGQCVANNSPANEFSTLEATFPDYTDAANLPSFHSDAFVRSLATTTNLWRQMMGGTHLTAGAISSILFYLTSAGNFRAGTRISLYGIG